MSPNTSRPRWAACLGAVVALALLAVGVGCQGGSPPSPSPAVSPIDRSEEEPFAVLDEVLDGRRVVLLGESSHGVAEFYERKAALARYLHEELGYGVLVFESGLADVATAYDDAGAMTTTELIDTSLLYDTDTLAPLFAHIQDTKGTPESLRLAGMDVQSKTLAEAVQPLVRNRPVDARFLAMSDLQGRLLQTLLGEQDLQGYNRLSRRFVAKADTLLRALDRSVPPGTRSYEEQAVIRNVENLRDFYSFTYEADRSGEAQFSEMQALRDSIMAENLFWLAETVFPEEKIIVWAHNGHVMKDNFAPTTKLGEYVQHEMPEQSYAVGVVAHEGAAFEEHQGNDTLRFRHDDPDMLEGRLAELGAPEVFVDLARPTGRPAWIDDSLQVAHNTTLTRTIVPADAFDGVYFLETVSPENYLSGQ